MLGGTIFPSLKAYINDPSAIWTSLGQAIPASSNFFVTCARAPHRPQRARRGALGPPPPGRLSPSNSAPALAPACSACLSCLPLPPPPLRAPQTSSTAPLSWPSSACCTRTRAWSPRRCRPPAWRRGRAPRANVLWPCRRATAGAGRDSAASLELGRHAPWPRLLMPQLLTPRTCPKHHRSYGRDVGIPVLMNYVMARAGSARCRPAALPPCRRLLGCTALGVPLAQARPSPPPGVAPHHHRTTNDRYWPTASSRLSSCPLV